jgi:ankyrin repeat protein
LLFCSFAFFAFFAFLLFLPIHLFVLHELPFSHNQALIELFLQNGAKLDRIDCNGKTPLHYAAALDSPSALVTLLRHGATVNVKDLEGVIPARDEIQDEFISLLL